MNKGHSVEEFIVIGISKLKLYQEMKDTEEAHKKADRVLCSILNRLNQQRVVQEYKKVLKWYG